jgi:hypothetical protein
VNAALRRGLPVQQRRIFSDQQKCCAKDEDQDGDGDKGGNGLQNSGLLKRPLSALLLGFHEQSEFLVERNRCLGSFLQFERQPGGCLVLPRGWQLCQSLRIRFAQREMAPKGGLFLGPKTQQTVVDRNSVNAVPKQRTELLGQRKIAKRFTMNPALALGDLQADCAQQLSISALSHLEFGDALVEIVGWEIHRFPQNRQFIDVIQCRAAHAIG